MFHLYVERKRGFQNEAERIKSDIVHFLRIPSVTGVRYLNRYDVENISDEEAKEAAHRIFSEPQSDECIFDTLPLRPCETAIAWEYLPGQYDQRSDSAEQCLLLLRESLPEKSRGKQEPRVRCAKVVLLSGEVSARDIERIQSYLINPVDSRLAGDAVPDTLELKASVPADIPSVEGFIGMDKSELASLRKRMALAMDAADVEFMQDYFKKEGRDPTETEIRVLDTYWSDHCRHTTFLTELTDIKIEDGAYAPLFASSLKTYTDMHVDVYGKAEKPVTLMDMAVIGAKYLRKHDKLDDLEASEENNACSLFIDVHYTTDKDGKPLSSDSPGETEKWLLLFKNETHNHPTEIEPFGGAATCIGGAIRDPLSGRAWVYQALRVTGAADPTVPISETIPGKLPQMKLCREAAQGFSSYGNQIGLATGQVAELYHPGYGAKRMECGAVIAASPADSVVRERPEAGDVVILLGGGTGRDGIGGATGSSKVHTKESVTSAGAEVQKGNAVEERKIQRLFRDKKVSLMIRRSNDFGAGGVSVAVGELAAGLDIDLDAVPKKYDGLNGTELAISESQERMAVVVREKDARAFIDLAAKENLRAVVVAKVTGTNRLVMKWRGKTIVDLSRDFLDAAGAPHKARAYIENPALPETSPLVRPLETVSKKLSSSLSDAWLANINDLACCSERGLSERFDGSIGAATVLFPFGGKYQRTPEAAMAAKIPVASPRETSTASMMSFGFDPFVGEWSAWHGAQTAVLSSLAKIVCIGGNAASCRLSFQEYFGRAVDEKTWGYPAAALLGALDAQKKTGCASIGGKDSMSGTFENINVPHTLVSFAVTHDEAKRVTSGSFKKSGSAIYFVGTPYSPLLAPDFTAFMQNAAILYRLNAAGAIRAMYPVGSGGIAEALTKMMMGNGIGGRIDAVPLSFTRAHIPGAKASSFDLFTPQYGSIILEAAPETESEIDKAGFVSGTIVKIGETIRESEIVVEDENAGIPYTKISLSNAEKAWESKLSKVFPPVSESPALPALPSFALAVHPSLADLRSCVSLGKKTFAAPTKKVRVLIPVFPGTNCEYDMARAFAVAGAETKIAVFANNTPRALEESLETLERELKGAQILALAGGFSGGDEPDGSGKFIANVLREGRIAEQVMQLIKKRDGLILGICNGFQALIKTGLVPFGEIRTMTADMPTLTFNTVGRHISRIARTRTVSALSPWALDPSVIDERVHLIPVSHGEGRIVVAASLAQQLFASGQVFSQYVDENGVPAVVEPDNPNGSLFAIEGLTSPDGRVLGKMGHSERTIGIDGGGASRDLIKNVAGDPLTNEYETSCQNIFAAGVRYFNN